MDRLLEDVEVLGTRGRLNAAEVTSVEIDSRHSGPGSLFCCIPGTQRDGHDFAPDAVRKGAVGLIVERPLDLEVAQAVVAQGAARKATARAAATFYDHPSRALTMLGVTGTNGKTTVTHLLASIFEASGLPTTVIGTLGGARTTPEAPLLQHLLADARESGQRAAALEVSSHALTQDRVEGITFDAAVFTNLGHDHLDHHGTIEEYFRAKSSLFTHEHAKTGVVSQDDPWGNRLLGEAPIDLVPYSLSDANEITTEASSTTFRWRGHLVNLRLAGLFQVPNALAAATTASILGVPDEVVVQGLSNAKPVPGRFEVVDTGLPLTVVVDYAHTPEGLCVALESARRLARSNRVIVVFGAGGDRDREKRPAMGTAAAQGADLTILTSDNPRRESPDRIIEEVLKGFPDAEQVRVEPDRRRAIEKAFDEAAEGDVVLIAGKGHESDMEWGSRRIAFDDRVEAKAAARRFSERSAGDGGATL